MIQSGLPLFPMLVRYDEVAQGDINHALLFNAPVASTHFMHPATRGVGDGDASEDIPPLGSRFRLEGRLRLRPARRFGKPHDLRDAEDLRHVSSVDRAASLFDLQGVNDERWDDELSTTTSS